MLGDAAGRWQPERLPEEVRRMAEAAAARAGMPLALWLVRVVQEASASERPAISMPERPIGSAAQAALAVLAQNLRHGDFPPLDEARTYLRLMTEFGLSAAEITAAVGRPRDHVARALRLLGLPESVRRLIERRALSAEHAYALIEAEDPAALAEAVLALGLAADETRRRARGGSQ
jgi:ParB family chromosome partitioning protein